MGCSSSCPLPSTVEQPDLHATEGGAEVRLCGRSYLVHSTISGWLCSHRPKLRAIADRAVGDLP